MRDREPCLARLNAQLKQKFRECRCTHPNNAINAVFLERGGYLEYCILCDKIIYIRQA